MYSHRKSPIPSSAIDTRSGALDIETNAMSTDDLVWIPTNPSAFDEDNYLNTSPLSEIMRSRRAHNASRGSQHVMSERRPATLATAVSQTKQELAAVNEGRIYSNRAIDARQEFGPVMNGTLKAANNILGASERVDRANVANAAERTPQHQTEAHEESGTTCPAFSICAAFST